MISNRFNVENIYTYRIFHSPPWIGFIKLVELLYNLSTDTRRTRGMQGTSDWESIASTELCVSAVFESTVDSLYLEHPLSRTLSILSKFSGSVRVRDRESQLYFIWLRHHQSCRCKFYGQILVKSKIMKCS